MIIEMNVAIALTTSVTMSVRRVLQMSWENTSWPSCVVPSRCCARRSQVRVRRWPPEGRQGAISPGNAATKQITSRITAPDRRLAVAEHGAQKALGRAL